MYLTARHLAGLQHTWYCMPNFSRDCYKTNQHGRDKTQDPHHQRPALRQWPDPPRPPGGVHPDRHLEPLPEDARPRLHLRLRRRCPRHPHHAACAGRGDRARGADRPRRPRTPGRLCRLCHRLRQLSQHPQPRESGAGPPHLQATARERPHRHPHHHPGLRPREGDVPPRPLHQGHLPQVRRRGSVRRQLRGVRRHLLPHRAEGRRLRHLRRQAD
jgi:hypothetical protein